MKEKTKSVISTILVFSLILLCSCTKNDSKSVNTTIERSDIDIAKESINVNLNEYERYILITVPVRIIPSVPM